MPRTGKGMSTALKPLQRRKPFHAIWAASNSPDGLIESTGMKLATIAEIRPVSAMPYAGMERAAQRFDLKQRYYGTVPWRYDPKRRGGRRIVCDPPLQVRVGQALGHDLIVSQHVPRPHIGLWQGRGIGRHVRAIAQALERGYPFAVVADVCSAFASVNMDAVYDLGILPPELIASSIDSRLLRFRQMVGDRRTGDCAVRGVTDPLGVYDGEQARPRGLLLGGEASNALFACFMDDLPDHLPGGVLPFVYGDDALVLCRTEQQALVAADALGRYFVGHRAGPLFHRHLIANVNDGFDHLGYRFEADGDRITVGLTTGHLIRVGGRALAELGRLSGDALYDLDIKRFVRELLSPYSSLDQADRDAICDHVETYVIARSAGINAQLVASPDVGSKVTGSLNDPPCDD